MIKLNKKHIIRINIKQFLQIMVYIETTVCHTMASAVCPDQVESGSQLVFPANYEIALKLPDIEIGIFAIIAFGLLIVAGSIYGLTRKENAL